MRKVILFLVISFYSITSIFAQTAESSNKLDLALYLLIGQSNMAGRGELDGQSITSDSILCLNKEGQWEKATDPLHFDKSYAGVGLGLTFALDVLEEKPYRKIGLIPCAVGGTSITKWQPSGKADAPNPYDNAISRAKIALKDGTLKGILWHQGETDSNDRHTEYEERFEKLLNNLANDLEIDINTIPIVIGEIGYFYVNKRNVKNGKEINEILNSIAQKHNNITCVSSAGLNHKGDSTHFDAPSIREMGRRYAKAYICLETEK